MSTIVDDRAGEPQFEEWTCRHRRSGRPCSDAWIGQYCPIALGAEIFAERWTPIIIRNLHLGCRRFGEILDGAPGLPRSVLAHRLRTLEQHGVVVGSRRGRATAYELTDCGRELAEVCLSLGAWGARWREAQPEAQDPYLALWTVCRLLDPTTLPRPRIVVRFDLTDDRRPNRYWLVLDRTGNEVAACNHPASPRTASSPLTPDGSSGGTQARRHWARPNGPSR